MGKELPETCWADLKIKINLSLLHLVGHLLYLCLGCTVKHTSKTSIILNKDRPTWCHLFYYFTIYCSTCFECYYIHLQELATYCGFITCVVLLWFDVCWCYVVVRLGWCGTIMQAEALLHCTARILQRSAPQPLPTTSSRTRTTHQIN